MESDSAICISDHSFLRIIRNDSLEDISWELRWININRGVIIWYISEFESAVEGFARIASSPYQTGRTLENGEIVIAFESDLPSGMSATIEIAVNLSSMKVWNILCGQTIECSDSFWLAFKSTLQSEMDQDDAAEKISVSQLILHIKGQSHPVPVRHDEDIEVASEKVLVEYKLKPEMRSKIEAELLRTKVDACNLFETRLQAKISRMSRSLGSIVSCESVASLALDHALAVTADLSRVEEMLPHLRAAIQRGDEMLFQKDRELEKLMQELRDQQALERLDHQSVKEMAVQKSAELLESQELVASLREENRILQAQMADATSAADVPPSEKERKLTSEIKELRLQKANLLKQLATARDDLHAATHELIQVRGKQAAKRRAGIFSDEVVSDEEQERDEQVLLDKVAKLESKVKTLKHSLSIAEDCNLSLRLQFSHSNSSLQQALSALKRCEDELSAAVIELATCKQQLAAENIQGVTAENKRLREQCLDLRGEVLRLQSDIEDVKSSAIQAIQELQVFGPEVNVGDMMTMLPSASRPGDSAREMTSMSHSAADTPHPYSTLFDDGDSYSAPDAVLNHNDAGAASAAAVSTSSVGDPAVSSAVYQLSVIPISNVLQERLFRNVFDRYLSDNSTTMNLTRFGRFSKEFGVCAPSAGAKSSFFPPFIVSGEVDIVFMNCIKLSAPDREQSSTPGKPFVVAKKRGTNGKGGGAGGTAAASAGSGTQSLSFLQFVVAVEQLACRVYAGLIEEQAGTTLDCLPPKQRELASKAALDVFTKKKIFPVAHKLELIPWPLIYVDELLSALQHPDSETWSALDSHAELMQFWYKHYASLTSGQSSSLDFSFDEFAAFSGGVAYKWLTKFAHDFGIVPYLLKESAFFLLFEEVVSWASSRRHRLLAALPEAIGGLPLADAQESFYINGSTSSVDFIGFVFTVAVVAIQAFPDISVDQRLSRLFTRLNQSGGAELIQRTGDV